MSLEFQGALDAFLAASVEHYFAGRFKEERCGCGDVMTGKEAWVGKCLKCQEKEEEESD